MHSLRLEDLKFSQDEIDKKVNFVTKLVRSIGYTELVLLPSLHTVHCDEFKPKDKESFSKFNFSIQNVSCFFSIGHGIMHSYVDDARYIVSKKIMDIYDLATKLYGRGRSISQFMHPHGFFLSKTLHMDPCAIAACVIFYDLLEKNLESGNAIHFLDDAETFNNPRSSIVLSIYPYEFSSLEEFEMDLDLKHPRLNFKSKCLKILENS